MVGGELLPLYLSGSGRGSFPYIVIKPEHSVFNNASENSFETGSVSNKAERGKHTTRHSELVKLSSGGFIIDTPGFSSFELQFTQTEELCSAFREFRAYTENCRFHDCSHTVEKGCAVLEALQSGNIPLSRHQSYVQLYEKLKQLKPWENK